MKKVVVGEMFIQDNQERNFGSDPQYIVMWAVRPDGENAVPLVFTKEEIEDAVYRSEKNPEDIPELGSDAPVNYFDDE